MPKYTATTGGRSYPIESADLSQLDLRSTGPDTYHLLHEGKAYQVAVAAFNRSAKSVSLRVNGQEIDVVLRDEIDQQIDALGFSTVEAVQNMNVIAPMPGLVLDILVEEGAEVSAGTPLIILEAMKMENVLKAEGSGVVETIRVGKGDAVEKKQLLIAMR